MNKYMRSAWVFVKHGVETEDGIAICQPPGAFDWDHNGEEFVKIGHLISAAPDLLKALEKNFILPEYFNIHADGCKSNCIFCKRREMAKYALAKAMGQKA